MKKYIVLSLLLLVSCIKPEEDVMPSQDLEPLQELNSLNDRFSLEVYNASEIPTVANALKEKLTKAKIKWSYSEVNKPLSVKKASKPIYWVDQENVMQLTNEVGDITYAYKINTSNYSDSTFYNLIVPVPADGKEREPYVIKYIHEAGVTRQDYRDQYNKRFKGRIVVYSLSNFAKNTGLKIIRPSTILYHEDTPCAMIDVDNGRSKRNKKGGSGGGGNAGSGSQSTGGSDGSQSTGGSESSSGSGFSSVGSVGFSGGGRSGSAGSAGRVEVGEGCFCKDTDPKNTDNKVKISFGINKKSKKDCPDEENAVPINDKNDELKSFLEQEVWDEQNPYDRWNELTECEKDFFRTSPHHLYNAQLNRSEAEDAAQHRFGNCDNGSDHPLHNTIGDAYRHAYFAALNTHNMGYKNAKKLGDAHECDVPISKLNEKEMDLSNNAWGYLYGSTVSYVNEKQFYNSFMDAVNKGQIKIIQECQ